MHDTDPSASPFNPLPWVVWALALPMIAMEVVLTLGENGIFTGPGGLGWRLEAVQRFSVAPGVMDYLAANGVWQEVATRLFAYSFVHGNFTHALFATVLLLALGKMVAEVFRWWAVLIVFFGAAVLGGIAFWQLVPEPQFGLVGAYPGVYGLIGAFSFLLWVQLVGTGGNRYRAFSLISMLMGVQLLFGLIFGGGYDWIADLTGFATGFALSFIVSPGGWGRVMAKLRAR